MSKRARKQRDKRAEADAVNRTSHDAEDDHEWEFWQEHEDPHSPQNSGLSFWSAAA